MVHYLSPQLPNVLRKMLRNVPSKQSSMGDLHFHYITFYIKKIQYLGLSATRSGAAASHLRNSGIVSTSLINNFLYIMV